MLRVELDMEDYGALQKSPSCMVEPLPAVRNTVLGSKVLYSKINVPSRARDICFGLVRYSLLYQYFYFSIYVSILECMT